MTMEKIYRKVLTKERLPKETNIYFTDLGKTPFFIDGKKMELNNTPALWWLEEIEIPADTDIRVEKKK